MPPGTRFGPFLFHLCSRLRYHQNTSHRRQYCSFVKPAMNYRVVFENHKINSTKSVLKNSFSTIKRKTILRITSRVKQFFAVPRAPGRLRLPRLQAHVARRGDQEESAQGARFRSRGKMRRPSSKNAVR